MTAEEQLKCPFCGESGFDAIGLKHHFFAWCEKFDEVESLEQERARRLAEMETLGAQLKAEAERDKGGLAK